MYLDVPVRIIALASALLAASSAQATEMVEIPNTPTPPPATAAAPPEHDAPSVDPAGEYERRYIAFRDEFAISAIHGPSITTVVLTRWSQPVEGKYQRELSYPEFYERVGRNDLADRFRARRNLRIGLIVGGALALLGGGGVMTWQLFQNTHATDACILQGRGGCSEGSDPTGYIAGGVVAGVGFIAMTSAWFVHVQPAEPHQVSEMADQYNQRLRRDLGLDHHPAPSPPPVTFTLAPTLQRDGAGVRLVGRF